jgi:hypothetical protein
MLPLYSPNAKVPEKKNRLQRAFAENEKKKNKTMAMRKKRSMYYQGGEVEAFNGGVDDQARRHRVVGLPPVLVRCGWQREMRLRAAGL